MNALTLWQSTRTFCNANFVLCPWRYGGFGGSCLTTRNATSQRLRGWAKASTASRQAPQLQELPLHGTPSEGQRHRFDEASVRQAEQLRAARVLMTEDHHGRKVVGVQFPFNDLLNRIIDRCCASERTQRQAFPAHPSC